MVWAAGDAKWFAPGKSKIAWKLLRVDEIRLLALLPNPVPEPRPDYRRGDKDIWLIYCQF